MRIQGDGVFKEVLARRGDDIGGNNVVAVLQQDRRSTGRHRPVGLAGALVVVAYQLVKEVAAKRLYDGGRDAELAVRIAVVVVLDWGNQTAVLMLSGRGVSIPARWPVPKNGVVMIVMGFTGEEEMTA